MTGLQQDIDTIGTIIALLLLFIAVELGLIIFGHLRRQRPSARQERRGARKVRGGARTTLNGSSPDPRRGATDSL
jgi:hypothetical protein